LDLNYRLTMWLASIKKHIFDLCLEFGVDKETITMEDYLFLFDKFAKMKRKK